MRNYQRDEYTPWSFVLPMTLAVALGILASDMVKLGVGLIMAKAAIDSLNESMRSHTTPGHLPARPNVPVVEPTIKYGPDAFSAELPGLLEANRRKLDRACIGGAVSIRERNGWSQDLSAGSPQRCIAMSQ